MPYVVDITADLNDDDGSGEIWALLDEARDDLLIMRFIEEVHDGFGDNLPNAVYLIQMIECVRFRVRIPNNLAMRSADVLANRFRLSSW